MKYTLADISSQKEESYVCEDFFAIGCMFSLIGPKSIITGLWSINSFEKDFWDDYLNAMGCGL